MECVEHSFVDWDLGARQRFHGHHLQVLVVLAGSSNRPRVVKKYAFIQGFHSDESRFEVSKAESL